MLIRTIAVFQQQAMHHHMLAEMIRLSLRQPWMISGVLELKVMTGVMLRTR